MLYEKNWRVRLATCELLANLSLQQDLQDMVAANDEQQEGAEKLIQTQLVTDWQSLLSVFRQAIVHRDDPEVKLKAFMLAVFGFFANLICFSSVRLFLLKDTNSHFWTSLVPDIIKEVKKECDESEENVKANLAVMHRLMFIADEYLREEEENVFDLSDAATKKDIMMCLQYFVTQNLVQPPNQELSALCGQFVE